jgi:pimeloyl-ACP methyl ester carboxylesterase
MGEPRLGCGARRVVGVAVRWAGLRAVGGWLVAVLVVALLAPCRVAAEPAWHNPVKVVADSRLTVAVPGGAGEIPVYLSADWSHALPNITRAVIVVHGVERDADGYLRGAEAARVAAGPAGEETLLIVPQFLADIDVATFHLSPVTLHWSTGGWSEGEPAHGPVPVSSFDVFDAILQHLAERALLPNLAHVVLAGHSAGGQVVQRYAVVGRGEAALAARGLVLRYVVANPSSYLYFSDNRPVPVDRAACPQFDRWKYGLAGAPPYVGDTTGMEARFAARQVVYLLGTADTDPRQANLDMTCGGEAEGAYRFARGEAYFAYLQARHPGTLAQRAALVPGVGHNGAKMFGSVCGLAALFDRPGCPGL